ncbi:MAG: hypothetical protein ABFR63_01305 [Thermodesulfobacteriota bacterium]
MKKLSVIILTTLLVQVWSIEYIKARPSKRYDDSTKQCRILDSGGLDWESDHWGTGARKFKEVCKSCHNRNNDKGAPFLYMESYGSEGWNNVFAKRKKKCAQDGSWDVLTQEELLLVNDYLYRNGNDTYDPNDADTCG